MSGVIARSTQRRLFDEHVDLKVGLTNEDKQAFVDFPLKSTVTDLKLNPNDAQSREADEKVIEGLLFKKGDFKDFKLNFLKLIHRYLKRLKERKPSTKLNPSLAFTSAFRFFNDHKYEVPGLNQSSKVFDEIISGQEMKQDFYYCKILKSFFKGILLQDAFNPNPPRQKANPGQIYNLVANIGEALVLFSQNSSEVNRQFLRIDDESVQPSYDRQLPTGDRMGYEWLHSA